jgi:hypothetical protein
MQIKFLLIAPIIILLFKNNDSQAQSKYFDKNCDVSFYSHTPVEDIEAKNSSAISILDIQSGTLEFAVLIKAFEFPKALMQEHFNENYMESEKFPKASFKGQVKNISAVNFKADGSYPVTVTGTLTMHGVSKEITTAGTIKVNGGNFQGVSSFKVNPEDYKIAIPGVVKDKIAKELEVKIDATYVPYVN